jgi:hypothetical protein
MAAYFSRGPTSPGANIRTKTVYVVEKIVLDTASSKGRQYLDYCRIVFVERMADMYRVVTIQHHAQPRAPLRVCPCQLSFAIHGLAISALICGSSRLGDVAKAFLADRFRLPLALDTAKYAI